MKPLQESIVLITGATGGLGRELSLQLLKSGCRLILSDINLKQLEVEAEKLISESGRTSDYILACIEADLSTQEGCEKLYQKTGEVSRYIDILINNAGIAFFGDYDQTPEGRCEALMQVNLMAPMRLTRLFLTGMKSRNSGHIVNISSVAGIVGTGKLATYSASKFGLRGFSDALHSELRDTKVDISCVLPFFTKTNILDSDRYGDNAQSINLPDFIVDDPKDVVRDIVTGIRRRQQHIYPSLMAKSLNFLQRFSPEAVNFITRILAR